MTMGYLPSRLPVSCLTMAPKFDRPNMSMIAAQPQQRGPLTELNTDRRVLPNGLGSAKKPGSGEPSDSYLSELYRQLKAVVDSKPTMKVSLMLVSKLLLVQYQILCFSFRRQSWKMRPRTRSAFLWFG